MRRILKYWNLQETLQGVWKLKKRKIYSKCAKIITKQVSAVLTSKTKRKGRSNLPQLYFSFATSIPPSSASLSFLRLSAPFSFYWFLYVSLNQLKMKRISEPHEIYDRKAPNKMADCQHRLHKAPMKPVLGSTRTSQQFLKLKFPKIEVLFYISKLTNLGGWENIVPALQLVFQAWNMKLDIWLKYFKRFLRINLRWR